MGLISLKMNKDFKIGNTRCCRSQWPRVLTRGSAEIVGSNPTGRMEVCCECCVLSGRGLCDELITRPETSYRLSCVVVCDLEISWMRRPWPTGGCRAKTNKVVRVPVCNGFGGLTPVILNPGTKEKCVVNFTARLSQLWERTTVCHLNMSLGGSQGRSGNFGVEKKKSLFPSGIRNSDPSARSLVAISTVPSSMII